MPSDPAVTVIIPCYNASRFIAETLESVFAQSYRNFNIIAADDGSSDTTLDILKLYSDRIKILRHPDGGNHGQAATYNLCLRHVDTEYIAFLDNDDKWHADKLKKQIDVFVNNPDVGLIYTNGNYIDANGALMHQIFNPKHIETNKPEDIVIACYIRTPSSVMVRNSILKQVGDFVVGTIPDHDMWIRLKEVTNFYYINENLHFYRIHDNQLSNKSEKRMWEGGFNTLARAIKRYHYPYSVKRKRLSFLHYKLAQLEKNNKSYKFIPHLLLSIYYAPSKALNQIYKAIKCKLLKS